MVIIHIFVIRFTEINPIINIKKHKVMNKTELIAKIAEGAGLSKVDAKKALEATLDAVTGAVKAGDKVALIGFGTFYVSERAARKGINVLTKETINIPAKKVVKFKAGADLKF
jgi:DNA-binding protein HU-beta